MDNPALTATLCFSQAGLTHQASVFESLKVLMYVLSFKHNKNFFRQESQRLERIGMTLCLLSNRKREVPLLMPFLKDEELRVLKCVANGLQSKEIAPILNCSKANVEQRIQFLFAKLDARSRPHLVALAIRDG